MEKEDHAKKVHEHEYQFNQKRKTLGQLQERKKVTEAATKDEMAAYGRLPPRCWICALLFIAVSVRLTGTEHKNIKQAVDRERSWHRKPIGRSPQFRCVRAYGCSSPCALIGAY